MDLDRDLSAFGSAHAVCDAHGDNESLKDWIAQHATETTCDYCDRTGGEPFAASFEDFRTHVFGSLLLEYNGADDEGIPYDSGEGGYQAPIHDTLDILIDEGVAHDQRLLDDLNGSWNGQPWVRRDAWGVSEQEALGYGWERFRNIVLYERRYWFVLAASDPYEPQAIAPDQMLPAVGAAIERADVVRRVSPDRTGTVLFRAHAHKPGEMLAGAARLGAPPLDRAASNRMSPAGISMFYAAEDPDTAVAEVLAAETDQTRTGVTIGVFEPLRDLVIVDLCDLPQMPGLFDEERAHARGALRFLGDFASQLAEAVRRDGLEHVEYVPTQVFSEWLRYEFRPSGEAIDGVRYRSSHGDGACAALFFGPPGAIDTDEEALQGEALRLIDVQGPAAA